jgi:hypothetical protein
MPEINESNTQRLILLVAQFKKWRKRPACDGVASPLFPSAAAFGAQMGAGCSWHLRYFVT